MEIKKIHQDFSVCKVMDYSLVNIDAEYSFIGKTDEEKSLVCITSDVPPNVIQRDDGWKGFRIQGILDFSLIGILSKIAKILAENSISILHPLGRWYFASFNRYGHRAILDCFDTKYGYWSASSFDIIHVARQNQ